MPFQPVQFMSPKRGQRIVMRPQQTNFQNGVPVGIEPGSKTIEFTNGVYTATSPEEVAFLRSRMNDAGGADLIEMGPQIPDHTPVLVELTQVESLEDVQRILDEERETFNRQVVIDTAEAIIERATAAVEPEPPKAKAKA